MNLGKLSHHAYSIEGEPNNVRQELWKVFENEWGVKTAGNPDFFYRKFAQLGIDESRYIKDLAGKKHFLENGKKIFMIEADGITLEAQNSLLKIFEEPSFNTHFFIIGNSAKSLIPTLASRVFRVRKENGKSGEIDEVAESAKKFLSLSVPSRMDFVKKFSDEIKSEKRPKSDALALIKKIEEILYAEFKKKEILPPKFFEDIEMCRDYLDDRSAGVKMVLEYAALVIPRAE